jgi:hypothetical protein
MKDGCLAGSGKGLIMAVSMLNMQPMMGFYYYFYFMACYFAGLFCRAIKP